MRLEKLHIKSPFKNLDTSKPFDFTGQDGVTVVIGNNGSGKSNLLEAISSVFAGIYGKKHKAEFDYILNYTINSKKIEIEYKKDTGKHTYKVDEKSSKSLPVSNTPTMVISAYSGEELRMNDKYYFDFFNIYNTKIITTKGTIGENQQMVFINKNHWNIALLTMILSDLSTADILGEIEIERIELEFNEKNVTRFNKLNPNEVTRLAQILFDNKDDLTLNKFKDVVFDTHLNLYKKLVVAHLPIEESYRLINKLILYFTNGTSTEDLSEGEKKQILIKFITRILATPDSLLLLDEPDSQIHIVKKEVVKTLLYDDDLKPHVNCVLTTHSPTLTQCFDNENVVMLNGGKLISKEKREIIEELTDEFWSKQRQNIFLDSDNDILLVEGKTDIKFIEEAIKKLDDDKYRLLENLEYFPTGGASGLRLFIDKFTPKQNQKIIGILDADLAGDNEVKEVLTEDEQKELEQNGFVKIVELDNTFLLKLPKLDRINDSRFELEDYFPTEKLTNISKNLIDTFKVLKNFTLKKETVKRKLFDEVESYEKADFEDFKKLFDLILEIQNQP